MDAKIVTEKTIQLTLSVTEAQTLSRLVNTLDWSSIPEEARTVAADCFEALALEGTLGYPRPFEGAAINRF